MDISKGITVPISKDLAAAERQPSFRVEIRRFAVEGLCLLMLLYGAPLQALESALPAVEVEASDLLLEVDAVWESAGQDLQTNLQTGFQTAWQTASDGASNLVHQPWADALTMMLTASSAGSDPRNQLAAVPAF